MLLTAALNACMRYFRILRFRAVLAAVLSFLLLKLVNDIVYVIYIIYICRVIQFRVTLILKIMKEVFLFNYKPTCCLECFSIWRIESTSEICCFTLKFGRVVKNTMSDMYKFLNMYSIL